MNKNDIEYRLNLIKGNIAEKTSSLMFHDLGYESFPCGIENAISNYQDIFNKLSTKSKNELIPIRNLPDFIIVSSDKKKTYQIEIKYSFYEYLDLNKLRTYQLENVFFIVFTNKDIKYVTSKEIMIAAKDNCKHKFKNLKLLTDCTQFDFNEEQKRIIRQYSHLSSKIFSNIPNSKDLCNEVNIVEEPIEVYLKEK